MYFKTKACSIYLIVAILLGGFFAQGQGSIINSFERERLELELESIFGTIESNYGPLKYKENLFSFSWEEVKAEYRQRLGEARDTAEIYFLYSELLNEFEDVHVGIMLPSTFRRSLPLQFSYVEDKTIVSFVSGGTYPKGEVIPEIGDELLQMDGKTPDEIRDGLKKYMSAGNVGTNKALLTMFMTSHGQQGGFPLDKVSRDQKSNLTFRRHSDGEEYSVQLEWKVSGAKISSRPVLPPESDELPRPLVAGQTQGMQPQWIDGANSLRSAKTLKERLTEVYRLQSQLVNLKSGVDRMVNVQEEESESAPARDRGARTEIGSVTPYFELPKNFKPIKYPLVLKPLARFVSGLKAGTFERNGQTVGFLRIASYSALELNSAYIVLQYTIKWLEENSDYLLIDQTNNPGGFVAYSDWIVQALVKEAHYDSHMKFAVRPTQDFLLQYRNMLESIREMADATDLEGSAKEVAEALVEKYLPIIEDNYNKVNDAFQRGDFFSEPVSLFVVSDFVGDSLRSLPQTLSQGNPILEKIVSGGVSWLVGFDIGEQYTYSKPAFMYINELDFSGGDATPAVLQDYGRVKLVGANTAGAGGSVTMFSNSVQLPFQYTLTNSLMVRADGRYVENVGVQPDIPFHLTVEDYQNGFSGVLDRLLNEIDASL